MEDSLKVNSVVGRGIASLIANKIIKEKIKGVDKNEICCDVLDIDIDHVDGEYLGKLSVSFHITDKEIWRLAKEAILK